MLNFYDYLQQFPNKEKEYLEAKSICSKLQDKGFQAVFAGGCVRDIFRNVEFNDIDIATNSNPEQVIDILKDYKIKEVGKAFGVVLVEANGYEFEIATFRKDLNCNGRKPSSVLFSSMKEDAKRRDFTINAVFYDPINDKIYDFVNGVKDIEEQTLRFVGSPTRRLKEDYLRILRCVRFFMKGFWLPKKYKKLVNRLASTMVSKIAPERIVLELKKLITNKHFFLTYGSFSGVYDSIFNTKLSLFNSDKKPCTFESIVALFFLDDVNKFKAWAKKYKLSKEETTNIGRIIEDRLLFTTKLKDSTIHLLSKKPHFEDLLSVIEYTYTKEQYEVYKTHKYAILYFKETPLPKQLITGDILLKIGFAANSFMGGNYTRYVYTTTR